MSLREIQSIDVLVNAAQPSLWSSIQEAVRGSHQDFTTGSLNRAILLLAIPMVLEVVLESLFAVVDVFWVSRLGAHAVATVGLTESLLTLVGAVGLGLSLSTTAMVARRIGEKDATGAAVAGAQAVFIGFGVSLLVGIPGFIYGPELLRLMGASPQVVAAGSGYARIALGGSGALLFLYLNNAIFRGAIAARVADGHRAVRDCDHELDWFGAHYQRVRVGCAGRLHHCDPHFDFCDDAVVGAEQRRRDASGAKPGRAQAGTRANFRVAHRLLQHDISGDDRRVLLDLCHADGAAVHA